MDDLQHRPPLVEGFFFARFEFVVPEVFDRDRLAGAGVPFPGQVLGEDVPRLFGRDGPAGDRFAGLVERVGEDADGDAFASDREFFACFLGLQLGDPLGDDAAAFACAEGAQDRRPDLGHGGDPGHGRKIAEPGLRHASGDASGSGGWRSPPAHPHRAARGSAATAPRSKRTSTSTLLPSRIRLPGPSAATPAFRACLAAGSERTEDLARVVRAGESGPSPFVSGGPAKLAAGAGRQGRAGEGTSACTDGAEKSPVRNILCTVSALRAPDLTPWAATSPGRRFDTASPGDPATVPSIRAGDTGESCA